MPLPPAFEARLVSARTLTPSVRELAFERSDGQPMRFEPGQWVNAFLPIPGEPESPEGPLKRSYSIASAPGGSSRFEIAVTRVQNGPGSTWLHGADLGAALTFVGPQGFFTRPPSNPAPSLMIATGTGVTPMRSMLRAALAAGSRAPMWVLLGVRHEEDILYRDEIDEMARDHANVRFEATLSQPRGAWGGRRGYVQAHVPELWRELSRVAGGGGTELPHAYVCGLERMVGSVRQMLRVDMGLPRQQVHAERYD
jgi:CDP-4-dehydro-6-deoxyglucose reductase, E3